MSAHVQDCRGCWVAQWAEERKEVHVVGVKAEPRGAEQDGQDAERQVARKASLAEGRVEQVQRCNSQETRQSQAQSGQCRLRPAAEPAGAGVVRERVDSQDGEQDGGRKGARDVELVLASSGADQRCANSVRSIATSSRLRTGASSRRAAGGNVVEEEEQKF